MDKVYITYIGGSAMLYDHTGDIVADLAWGREDGKPYLTLRRIGDNGATDVDLPRERAVDICVALELLEKAIRKALPPIRPVSNEKWIDAYYGPDAPMRTGD